MPTVTCSAFRRGLTTGYTALSKRPGRRQPALLAWGVERFARALWRLRDAHDNELAVEPTIARSLLSQPLAVDGPANEGQFRRSELDREGNWSTCWSPNGEPLR